MGALRMLIVSLQVPRALWGQSHDHPQTQQEAVNVPVLRLSPSMDLTEAEDSKKRWQECTEELYKKDLNNSDNHDGVITHLEPGILECEVKWALEQSGPYKQS